MTDCKAVEEPPVKKSKLEPTVLFLVRHGDRWDFANKQVWKSAAKQHGFEQRDPPLSALGHEQARWAGEALSKEGVEVILSSPYLRTVQTAQPLAHACGLPINIEEGLAECDHVPGAVPAATARFPFFPEIDTTYDSMVKNVVAESVDELGRPQELFPLEYLQRMVSLAKLLPARFPGKRVACFSHAASVALVAALVGTKVFEAGKFAPAGIFKLVSLDGNSWTIERHGCDNSGHVLRNDPTTFPWGFMHCKNSEDEIESAWQKALEGESAPGDE